MKELLAGMMGVTDTQPVLRAGLRALRRLVIGHVPDFVWERSIQYVADTISQTRIGKQERIDCLRAYFLSSGQPERFSEMVAGAIYDYSLRTLIGANDPALRLAAIAGAILHAIRSFPTGG
jgi:hypothetical protein